MILLTLLPMLKSSAKMAQSTPSVRSFDRFHFVDLDLDRHQLAAVDLELVHDVGGEVIFGDRHDWADLFSFRDRTFQDHTRLQGVDPNL